MPDSITPVAAQIQPPDINKGLNTLSSILGVQQQRQNLQTGQYAQATAQAESQQAQQKNVELQALQQFTQNAVKDPSYTMSDGTPDIGKYQKGAMAVAPTYGQAMIGQLSSNFKEAIEARRSMQSLSTDQNTMLANGFKGLAGNPNATRTDLMNVVEQMRSNNKDPGFNRALDNALFSFDKNDIPGSAAKSAASLAGISPTSGQNAAGQVQVVNPLNQARSMPQLGPGATNPTTPQVAGQAVRQTGTGNADIDTSNMVIAGQKDARANIDLTKRIDQLADVVDPGALPAKVSHALGSLGLQNVNQARTELQKDLGRLQTSASARAGSDQRAQTILSGLPTDQTPTQTIHQAMDITRGSARQDLALGQLREKASKNTNGQMNGFQGDYAHAVSAASPLMHEYFALSPSEQVGFFQRNFKTKEQAKAFRAQAESVKKMSPDVIGQ